MTTTAITMTATLTKVYKNEKIYEVLISGHDKQDKRYVVIKCLTKVFQTLADAKRYISGESCTNNVLNAKYSDRAMEIIQVAKEQYRKDNNLQPSTPAMSEELYNTLRKDYKDTRLALLEQCRERVNEFVADILKGYGNFKAIRIYEDYISISLVDGDKQVFGCNWDVYIRDDVFEKKPTHIECNIGTCGSFEIGTGGNQELLYVAFARFITMLNECGLAKYLIHTHDEIRNIGRKLSELDEDYRLMQLETL